MTQPLYLNILDPQYARYVQLRNELEEYLIEQYGEDIDFQITLKHENDRWTFYAPAELNRNEIRKLTKEIVRRSAAAAGESARLHGSQR